MSTSAPPEGQVFFTDRDLGSIFPRALREAGLDVRAHADHFTPSAADETWLETVGRNGWIALTHDGRIRYKPNEQVAVVRHRVALLVVVGKAPHSELAIAFVATLPLIQAFVRDHERPFIGRVYRGQQQPDGTFASGRVELTFPR